MLAGAEGFVSGSRPETADVRILGRDVGDHLWAWALTY